MTTPYDLRPYGVCRVNTKGVQHEKIFKKLSFWLKRPRMWGCRKCCLFCHYFEDCYEDYTFYIQGDGDTWQDE